MSTLTSSLHCSCRSLSRNNRSNNGVNIEEYHGNYHNHLRYPFSHHHPHTQSLINPFSHHRVPTNRRKKTAAVAKSLSLLSVMVKSGLSTVIQRSHFRSHFLPHLKNWWLKEDGVSWYSTGWSTGRWVPTSWIATKLHLITIWSTMKRSIWLVWSLLFSFLRSGTLDFQNKIWLLWACDV